MRDTSDEVMEQWREEERRDFDEKMSKKNTLREISQGRTEERRRYEQRKEE